MRKVFKEDNHERTIGRNGWIKIELLNDMEVSELVAFYKANAAFQKTSGLHFSLASDNYAFRRNVNEEIQKSIRGKVETLLDEYRMLYGNFMVKEPGPEGDFPLHQDWTYVDEPDYRSIAVWVALTDNDERSGCLQLVEQSHNWGDNPRGPSIAWSFENVTDYLKTLLVPIPLKAGEALIWDHRLIHASQPNVSSEARIAATAIFVPAKANVFHYTREMAGTERICKRHVDENFFLSYTMRNMNELNPPMVEESEVIHVPYTVEQLKQMVNGCWQ